MRNKGERIAWLHGRKPNEGFGSLEGQESHQQVGEDSFRLFTQVPEEQRQGQEDGGEEDPSIPCEEVCRKTSEEVGPKVNKEAYGSTDGA